MYKKTLVSELVSEGHRLLDALRRNRFTVSAAVWYWVPESLEWRLAIVSPTVGRSGPMAAYTRVQRVLASINPSHLTLTDISVISPTSQEFQNLRVIVSSPGRFSTGSATGHIHDVVVEDNYIYQV
jgi:hypothetical protein